MRDEHTADDQDALLSAVRHRPGESGPMRQLLVEHARRKGALKRGATWLRARLG